MRGATKNSLPPLGSCPGAEILEGGGGGGGNRVSRWDTQLFVLYNKDIPCLTYHLETSALVSTSTGIAVQCHNHFDFQNNVVDSILVLIWSLRNSNKTKHGWMDGYSLTKKSDC